MRKEKHHYIIFKKEILSLTADNKFFEVAKFLKEITLLHYSAQVGHFEVVINMKDLVKLLIQKGTNKTHCDYAKSKDIKKPIFK
ncbi:MAG: hypothetical protein ABIL49_02645 [candidate division WOR-3 bacterium]